MTTLRSDSSESTPRRSVIVWAVLVLATCATFWLGTDHPFAHTSTRLAGTIAIVVGFAKVCLIGMDFMEIRDAPRVLKVVFAVWLMTVGGVVLMLYLV